MICNDSDKRIIFKFSPEDIILSIGLHMRNILLMSVGILMAKSIQVISLVLSCSSCLHSVASSFHRLWSRELQTDQAYIFSKKSYDRKSLN